MKRGALKLAQSASGHLIRKFEKIPIRWVALSACIQPAQDDKLGRIIFDVYIKYHRLYRVVHGKTL